jgi:hypothetical protein
VLGGGQPVQYDLRERVGCHTGMGGHDNFEQPARRPP